MPVFHPSPAREKVFRRVPGSPMGQKAKKGIMRSVELYNAKNRKPGQHHGPITPAFQRVLIAMLWKFHNSRTGYCFPSYETIAAAARCCRDTVYEAIRALEVADILDLGEPLRQNSYAVPRCLRPRVHALAGHPHQ